MAKEAPMLYPTIQLVRLMDDRETVDFATPLGGPYDAAPFIQTWSQEAAVKGAMLIITAYLMPKEEFYGVDPQPDMEDLENGEGTDERTTGS